MDILVQKMQEQTEAKWRSELEKMFPQIQEVARARVSSMEPDIRTEIRRVLQAEYDAALARIMKEELAEFSPGIPEPAPVEAKKVRCPTKSPEEAKRYTYRGESKTLTEWARAYGMKRSTLKSRLEGAGWPIEKALTEPIQYGRGKQVEWAGESHTLTEWGKITGVPAGTISHRLFKAHWPVEKALTTPVICKGQPKQPVQLRIAD